MTLVPLPFFLPLGLALHPSRLVLSQSEHRPRPYGKTQQRPAENHGQDSDERPDRDEHHRAPFFPVYGLTLPLALQLFDFRPSGDVRTCGGRYTPAFVVDARTRTGRAKAGRDSSNSRAANRIPAQHPTARVAAATDQPFPESKAIAANDFPQLTGTLTARPSVAKRWGRREGFEPSTRTYQVRSFTIKLPPPDGRHPSRMAAVCVLRANPSRSGIAAKVDLRSSGRYVASHLKSVPARTARFLGLGLSTEPFLFSYHASQSPTSARAASTCEHKALGLRTHSSSGSFATREAS